MTLDPQKDRAQLIINSRNSKLCPVSQLLKMSLMLLDLLVAIHSTILESLLLIWIPTALFNQHFKDSPKLLNQLLLIKEKEFNKQNHFTLKHTRKNWPTNRTLRRKILDLKIANNHKNFSKDNSN